VGSSRHASGFHDGLRTLLAAASGVTLASLALLADEALGAGSIASGNARVLLGAVFAAVVTVGAFAFWMRPIAAQLAATTIPPRVVSGHLHDRFQRGIVFATIGALSYESVVLLCLPASSGSDAPSLSTVLGTVIGVGAVTALFVAMQRATQTTNPSVLVAEAAHRVMERVRQSVDDEAGPAETPDPRGDGTPITAPRSGWVQSIDVDAVLESRDCPCTVILEVDAGTFVVADWTVVATVESAHPVEDGRVVAEALQIGDVRATDVDLHGSLSQFVDIALHMSAGASASPSTLYECFWYLGAILHELIDHELGGHDRARRNGRAVIRGRRTTRGGLVHFAVDRIRQATAGHPDMALEFVRVLCDVRRAAVRSDRLDVLDVLDRQGELAIEQCRSGGGLQSDIDRVSQMWEHGREANAPTGSRGREYPTRGSDPRDSTRNPSPSGGGFELSSRARRRSAWTGLEAWRSG
jgi:uncharacterized membrane protein